MLAAHHHDVPEDLLEQSGRIPTHLPFPLHGGRAGEQAAQEPARAVDADEPDEPHPGGGLPGFGRHPGHELGTERPLDLLAVPARLAHLRGDLGPDVLPQRASPGRGERLDLHLALAVPDGHPRAVLVGHDELDLVLWAHRHLQAAQVNPLPRREGLPGVPGAL